MKEGFQALSAELFLVFCLQGVTGLNGSRGERGHPGEPVSKLRTFSYDISLRGGTRWSLGFVWLYIYLLLIHCIKKSHEVKLRGVG